MSVESSSVDLAELVAVLEAAPADMRRARLAELVASIGVASRERRIWSRFLSRHAHLVERGGAEALLQRALSEPDSSPISTRARAWVGSTGALPPPRLVGGTPRPRRDSRVCAIELGADRVFALAVDPDRGWVVAGASESGSLHIVDLASGVKVARPRITRSELTVMELDAASGLVLCGGWGGEEYLWDLVRGDVAARLDVPADEHPCACAFVDGHVVVAHERGASGTLVFWNIGRRAPIAHVAQDRAPRGIVALRGGRVLTAGRDLEVWDAATGRRLATLGTDLYPRALAVSPDGESAVYALDDRVVRIAFEGRPHERTLVLDAGRITALAVSTDGATAALGDAEGRVRLWTFVRRQASRPFGAHAGEVASLAFAGPMVVSGGADGAIRLWDRSAPSAPAPPPRRWFAIDPVRRRTYAGPRGGVSGELIELDLAGAPLGTVCKGDEPRSLVLDGERGLGLAVHQPWKPGPVYRLVDLERRAVLAEVATEGPRGDVTAAALIPGTWRALVGHWDGRLELWDLGEGRRLRTLREEGADVTVIGVTRSGDRALAMSSAGKLEVWELAGTSPPIAISVGGFLRKHGAAIHPEGRWIVCGHEDHHIAVWDLEAAAAPARVLPGVVGLIDHIAFSADGSRVLAVDRGPSIWMWTFDDGELVGRWHNDAAIEVCAFLSANEILIGDRANLLGRVRFRAPLR